MPDLKPTPGGRQLDPTVRKKLEEAFGEDLSAIRVHQDAAGNAAAGALQAKAYTHGNDIFFNRGAYQPNTESGKRLLVQEVAHVLQQRKPGAKMTGPDPVAEKQAEALAAEALKRMR